MIVLNVSYQCKPGLRDQFLEMIRTEGLDAASRADAGNLKYDYYLPAEGGDELLLLEKWTGAAALTAHLSQPHLSRLGELKREYVLDTVVERFELEA